MWQHMAAIGIATHKVRFVVAARDLCALYAVINSEYMNSFPRSMRQIAVAAAAVFLLPLWHASCHFACSPNIFQLEQQQRQATHVNAILLNCFTAQLFQFRMSRGESSLGCSWTSYSIHVRWFILSPKKPIPMLAQSQPTFSFVLSLFEFLGS